MIEAIAGLLSIAAAWWAALAVGHSAEGLRLKAVAKGGAVGVACLVFFFMATVSAGAAWPGLLDARLVGLWLIAVGVLAPGGGAAIAGYVHFREERADAARLPF